jgi:multisubunit Na+/H+ antiporter MnhB subunit
MKRTRAQHTPPVSRRWRAALGVLAVCLWLGMAWALIDLQEPSLGVAPLAFAELPRSGVEHPVTAVLLNFRSYDTLLEIGVLLLAVIAAVAVREAGVPQRLRGSGPPGPVLAAMARALTPVIILVAGYLLWAGEHAPGGAFQAGAVLGAGLVLLLLCGMVRLPRARLRALVALGFALFLAAAGGLAVLEGNMLQFPPRHAQHLIVLIEAALTLSIGATFAVLFAVAPPAGARRHRERDDAR